MDELHQKLFHKTCSVANFFKKHPKLWLFFLLKPKSETPYNIASPLKNFLLKGHYECNCCTSTSLMLLIDGIHILRLRHTWISSRYTSNSNVYTHKQYGTPAWLKFMMHSKIIIQNEVETVVVLFNNKQHTRVPSFTHW